MGSYAKYENTVLRGLWRWADQHHRGELDSGKRQGRPPVLGKRFASNGVLVPPDGSKANDIRAAIPPNQRHGWFRSLKSSQALTQSVFGAVRAFDRFDLLRDVSAECGRPAFFEDHHDWSLIFEHEVDSLQEPRRTSIDVLLSGLRRRVAIECKFTERKFGTCSRPSKPKYSEQYCDGSYRIQFGRQERCALTEVGIRYWHDLPHLFDWPADRDHMSCLFHEVYQLGRNALGAVLASDSELDPSGGHALVIYDACNPEFQKDGTAERQWALATEACLVPGFMRRLMTVMARAPELAYLVDSVGRKYGLQPE